MTHCNVKKHWPETVKKDLGLSHNTFTWASQVAIVAKNPPAHARDARDASQEIFLGQGDPLEEEMPTHSSILA